MTHDFVMIAAAGPSAGLGHLMRSTAVALELRASGASVVTLAHGEQEPRTIEGVGWRPLGSAASLPAHSVAVADGYDLGAGLLEQLSRSPKLVWMHRPPAGAPRGVLHLDVPGRSGPLSGLRFACLRPGLSKSGPRILNPDISRVLLTTGGGDLAMPVGELATRVRRAESDAELRCVVGPYACHALPAGTVRLVAPSSLREELFSADLLVCAAGQTMLEAAATGAPTIALILASNQERQADLISEAGAAVVITSPDALEAALDEVRPLARREALSEAARGAVDGRGAGRVAARFNELLR